MKVNLNKEEDTQISLPFVTPCFKPGLVVISLVFLRNKKWEILRMRLSRKEFKCLVCS